MKRIYFILIFIILCIFVTGCTDSIMADTYTIETAPETIVVTETVIVQDTAKISQLESQLKNKQEEVEAYKKLVSNLDELLSCVYYGYASNDDWISDGFTAFSLKYKDKYYIITAGHAIEKQSYGKFYNHKFKANFSNEWIYPKLLDYKIITEGDYAIFYDKNINMGLIAGQGYPEFFLRYNDIKRITENKIPGDSGSPIINIKGEVVGMIIGDYNTLAHISEILEAIDNLK